MTAARVAVAAGVLVVVVGYAALALTLGDRFWWPRKVSEKVG